MHAATQARDGFDIVAVQEDQTQVDVAYDHSHEPREGACDKSTAEFIVAFDPVRMLAECQVKRQVIDHEQGPKVQKDFRISPAPVDTPVLRLLALAYSDHRDYHEAWRP